MTPDDIRIFGAVPERFEGNRFERERSERLVETMREILREESVEGISFDLLPECPNLWASEPAIPLYESELVNPRQMVFAEVCLSPLDFIRLQAAQSGFATMGRNPSLNFEPPHTPERFLSKYRPGDAERTNIGVFVEKLRGDLPTDIPIPVVQFNIDGEFAGFQEGRTRGTAAYLAGLDSMNCLFAVNQEGHHVAGVPKISFAHEWRNYLDDLAEDYDRRTAAVETASPATRWQRLMESSHDEIEALGITEGSLPDREGP